MSMQISGTNSPIKFGADLSMYGPQTSATQSMTLPNSNYNLFTVNKNEQADKYQEARKAVTPEGTGKKLDLNA